LTLRVSFPTPNQIQVDVNHPNLGLIFAPVIGFDTARVATTASAALNGVAAVPGGAMPLGIYCKKPGGCTAADLPLCMAK
jgi:hypothetical protein